MKPLYLKNKNLISKETADQIKLALENAVKMDQPKELIKKDMELLVKQVLLKKLILKLVDMVEDM